MNKLLLISILLVIPNTLFSQTGRSEKRGIAYGHHSEADLEAISQGLSWWYNWYHQPEAAVIDVYQNYNMEFVPMTWNNSFNETGLRDFYASHPEAKYLLAFNEPNFIEQANMKPSEVAAAWPRLEAIAAEYNLEIVGPAVNWCGTCVTEDGVTFTNPYAYLDTFFSACPNCQIDYIAVHNYMCYTSALKDYIDGFKKYGKKIWLTEFACWDQNNIILAMQKELMKSAIDYLENDTMVFRYAWFTGNRSGGYPYLDIFAPHSGKLTELGELYITYKVYVPDTTYYTPIPKRIEAEHYTRMYGISTEVTSDFDGKENVGWIDAGDWLEYNVDIPVSATYYLYFRTAGNAGKVVLKIDGENADTLVIPATGNWQSWQTLQLETSLPAGEHKIRLYSPTGGFNLNWISILDHANTTPTVNAGNDQFIDLPENTVILTGVASDENEDTLSYKWSKISGPSSFEIKNPFMDVTEINGLAEGKYTFKLEVSDGTVLASDEVVVEVSTPVGLNQHAEESFNIYPNPLDNILNIHFPAFSGLTEITISDALGKQIRKYTSPAKSKKLVIDVASLKKGYYILNLTQGMNTANYPIIKAD